MMMYRPVAFWMAIAAIACSVQASAQTAPPQPGEPPAYEAPLTNDEIVKLTKAALGSDAVVAKIKQATSETLDVSTDALITLRQKRVSNAVIAAMVDRVAKRATATAGAKAPGGQSPDQSGETSAPPSGAAGQSRGDTITDINQLAAFFCKKAIDDSFLKIDDDTRPSVHSHTDYRVSECNVANGNLRVVESYGFVQNDTTDPLTTRMWNTVITTTVPLAALEWPASRKLSEKRWFSLELVCANAATCAHLAIRNSAQVCSAGETRHFNDCRETPSSADDDSAENAFGFADEEEFFKASKALSRMIELSGGKKKAEELF